MMAIDGNVFYTLRTITENPSESVAVIFSGVVALILIVALVYFFFWWLNPLVRKMQARARVEEAEAEQELVESSFLVGRYHQMADEWGLDLEKHLAWMEKRMDWNRLTPKEKLRSMALDKKSIEKPDKETALGKK